MFSGTNDEEWDDDLFDEDASGESEGSESEEETSGDDEADDSHEKYVSNRKGKEREHPDTEDQPDQDFEHLLRDIRDGEPNTGALSKVWDFDMKDRNAQFKDDLREASGVGKRRGRKRGRKKGVTLSREVEAILGEGNHAFIDGNIPEAIRIMQEVIRIEPRAGNAWNVLAQCYESTGDVERGLRLRVMGAHVNQDPEEWDRLAEQSRARGYHQQALYCYGKLYQLDPSNINALWDRASLAKEIGELRIARSALLALLKRVPHDLNVLAELRPVLIELSDFRLCASLFDDAFNHYQTAFSGGHVPSTDPAGPERGAGFGLMEVLVLADLHNTLGQYQRTVETIRRGCRWLQGRASQKFWDAIPDDREWDIPGPNGESTRAVTAGEIQPGMHLLDINARQRLAIARIKLGDSQEGKMHADIVLSQDVAEYAALFGEIADAYFERGTYAEAGHIYEMLGGDATTSSLHVLLQAAACRRMLGDVNEAAEVYEHVIKADPSNYRAKFELAGIYEELGQLAKALDLLNQIKESRRKTKTGGTGDQDAEQAPHDGPGSSLFDEKKARGKDKGKSNAKQGRLTHAQLRELEQENEKKAAEYHLRLKELWPPMLAGDDVSLREWMVKAEQLIESFRVTKALFPTTRNTGFKGLFPQARRRQQWSEANEENMASRLQLDLGRETLARKGRAGGDGTVDSFRTIGFDDWLRLFMQYSFNLTKRGEFEEAQEILVQMLYCSGFQKRHSLDTIRCSLITCAIHAGRYDVVVEQSRKLVNGHQFNNEPIRILLGSLGNGLHATDAFVASTLTKHMLREIRSVDTALKSPESLRWNPTLRRYGIGTTSGENNDGDEGDADKDEAEATTAAGQSNEQPKLPSKSNPIIVALYGQLCLALKSYQSALFYLLHAYDFCPHDPLICLCLAIASIGRAMQRQADNRHHLIAQASTFLSRYRDLRGPDAPDEVEYNFGRAFHHLGLLSLAVKHYENVLSQTERRLQENPDVSLHRFLCLR